MTRRTPGLSLPMETPFSEQIQATKSEWTPPRHSLPAERERNQTHGKRHETDQEKPIHKRKRRNKSRGHSDNRRTTETKDLEKDGQGRKQLRREGRANERKSRTEAKKRQPSREWQRDTKE